MMNTFIVVCCNTSDDNVLELRMNYSDYSLDQIAHTSNFDEPFSDHLNYIETSKEKEIELELNKKSINDSTNVEKLLKCWMQDLYLDNNSEYSLNKLLHMSAISKTDNSK